jgi:hypothetical protein
MNRIIRKVDRIKSLNEALELESIGVDMITVSLNDGGMFSDDRVLDKAVVFSIREGIKKAKLVGEVNFSYDISNVRSFLYDVDFDFIQVVGPELPSLDIRREIQAKEIGIIYGGIETSYEDDPSWILSKYNQVPELNASFYQVDLLGDIDNSWHFLNLESPNYPEELQIKDIVKLGEHFPLIISLNFCSDNIIEIVNNFSSIRGINMILGEFPKRNDFHYFDYATVLETLKILNKTN